MKRAWRLALFLVMVGCGPGGESECDVDPTGCDESIRAFVVDTQCTLTGDLEVELGFGSSGFTPLEAGAFPRIHSGSQGGNHIYLGLRVPNAVPDQHPWLLVDVRVTADGALVGSRKAILGKQKPLRLDADGVVEEYGLLVFLETPHGEKRAVDVTVKDPCNRVGHASQQSP